MPGEFKGRSRTRNYLKDRQNYRHMKIKQKKTLTLAAPNLQYPSKVHLLQHKENILVLILISIKKAVHARTLF